MSVIWTLIRKEVRLYRPVMVAALGLALLCEGGVTIAGVYFATHPSGSQAPEPLSLSLVGSVLLGGAGLAVIFNCFFAGVLGGVSLPIERRERWADLPAMLPISRSQIVISKLVAGGGLYVMLCAAHLALLMLGVYFVTVDARAYVQDRDGMFHVVGTAYLLSTAAFGVAWLASTFLRSPTYAAVLSLGTVGGAFLLERLNLIMTPHTPARDDLVQHAALAAIAGVLAAVGGTVYYLRRVAP
jgi:hypothetical protein